MSSCPGVEHGTSQRGRCRTITGMLTQKDVVKVRERHPGAMPDPDPWARLPSDFRTPFSPVGPHAWICSTQLTS
ncbi:hypothetical protein CTRI78_v009307 [Colletotrichum trifolii]|uniref:Uncharacterized protein n=1 Tax=Colletotrichum trifolii TaxID=5466 RepID=A0A4V3HTX5_COLTR|nr:hypothetical protein CTRI78_v009307 [Colletotrichum trifolii]